MGLVTAHKTKLHLLGGAMHPEVWQSIPATLLDRIANVAQTSFDMVLADMGSQFGLRLGADAQGISHDSGGHGNECAVLVGS